MKKLSIALLVTLACNNAFAMEENAEQTNLNTQEQVQVNPAFKQDLIKGAAGLAAAVGFGYMSMKCSQKSYKNWYTEKSTFDNFANNCYKYTGEKIFNMLPESSVRRYCHNRIGIVGNALIAFQCAKYAADKLGSAIASKTPDTWKKRLSETQSTITTKVQNNWKRPFSAIHSFVKSRLVASKAANASNDNSQKQSN